MKLIFLITSTLIIFSPSYEKTFADFDSELSYIAREFKSEIMDEEECERRLGDSDDLAREIEEAIEEDDKYSPQEILGLKKLLKEAEALRNFIGTVCGLSSYTSTIEDFYLANSRVGANLVREVNGKFCVDVISVRIGDYVAYLLENNSDKNYSVSYQWKTPTIMNSGSGTGGLMSRKLRHIFGNRDNPNAKRISVFGVKCREF